MSTRAFTVSIVAFIFHVFITRHAHCAFIHQFYYFTHTIISHWKSCLAHFRLFRMQFILSAFDAYFYHLMHGFFPNIIHQPYTHHCLPLYRFSFCSCSQIKMCPVFLVLLFAPYNLLYLSLSTCLISMHCSL